MLNALALPMCLIAAVSSYVTASKDTGVSRWIGATLCTLCILGVIGNVLCLVGVIK